MKYKCVVCAMEKEVPASRGKRRPKFCSNLCRGEWMKKNKKMESHFHWKGGRVITVAGYVLIRIDGAYKYEHRHFMEKAIGRKLKRNELVHHIDGNKANNTEKNLVLITHLRHNRIHQNHWKRWRKNKRGRHDLQSGNENQRGNVHEV